MVLARDPKKAILIALVAVFALLLVYRIKGGEEPKTAPLVYERGAVASSPVRRGSASPASDADPLSVYLERRAEKYPGVARDIFRMEDPAPPRPKQASVVPQAAKAADPPAHVKTPEELAAEAARAAADAARADLSKFRFLGYLTDEDNTLFLSKDGELFILKSGDKVLKSYKVKDAGKDYVVLLDTITRVEVRVDFSGSVPLPMSAQPPPAAPAPASQPQPQPQPQQLRQLLQPPPAQPEDQSQQPTPVRRRFWKRSTGG